MIDLEITIRIGAGGDGGILRVEHAAARGDRRAQRTALRLQCALLECMRDQLAEMIEGDRQQEGGPR